MTKEINWNHVVLQARNIAQIAHRDQTDREQVLKFNHAETVANGVGSSLFLKAVAYLHDVLEDCPDWTSDKLLQEGIPDSVVGVVSVLTHAKEKESYEQYMERVMCNELAMQVKLSDLKHNMDLSRIKRPLTDYEWKRTQRYHRYYVMIMQRLGMV